MSALLVRVSAAPVITAVWLSPELRNQILWFPTSGAGTTATDQSRPRAGSRKRA